MQTEHKKVDKDNCDCKDDMKGNKENDDQKDDKRIDEKEVAKEKGNDNKLKGRLAMSESAKELVLWKTRSMVR